MPTLVIAKPKGGVGKSTVSTKPGDLLPIDRAIHPARGHGVIAVVGEKFVCRQLRRQGAPLRLHAPGATRPDIHADEVGRLARWGVLIQVTKTLAV